jgi:hypothetical protein
MQKMLIERHEIVPLLAAHGIKAHSVLHIGAHDCEELGFYNSLQIPNENVVWVDAIQEKVDAATARGIPNVFYGVMSDADGETVTFKRTNNDQSSSILDLGTHATHYPWITVSETRSCTTTTVDTFLADKPKPNFWNLDIQGAELKALQGGVVALRAADVVYTEVNTESVYQGCALLGDLDEFLAAQGFTRVALKLVEQGWGDAMYVRTSTPPHVLKAGAELTQKVPVVCFKWTAEYYADSLRILDQLTGLGFREFHIQESDETGYIPPCYEYTADQVKSAFACKSQSSQGNVWAR